MGKKYIHNDGQTVKVYFPCIIEKEYRNAKREGKTWVFIETEYSFTEKFLSVYYRPETTWDDHMGNTPCGYYCNVPMPDGKKKRVYIF